MFNFKGAVGSLHAIAHRLPKGRTAGIEFNQTYKVIMVDTDNTVSKWEN